MGGLYGFFLIVTGLIVSCLWFPARHAVIRGLSVWIGTERPSQFNEAALSQAFTLLNWQELCCSLSFQEQGEKNGLKGMKSFCFHSYSYIQALIP